MNKKHFLTVSFFALLFASCQDNFDYTVYSEHVDAKRRNTIEKNKQEIDKTNQQQFSDFSIFLISDTHLYYRELRDARRKINSLKDSADFLIHCGDISNEGLSKEYEFTWDLMDEINLPYLTVIGNHDLLANGRAVYQKMFGKENYTYIYKNCKFVFFDDNVWENTVIEPDFEWLQRELTDSLNEFTHIFLVCHIPPWDEQLFNTQKHAFYSIVDKSKVQLCLYGHFHVPEIVQDSVNTSRTITHLVNSSVRLRKITKLDITKDTFNINFIEF